MTTQLFLKSFFLLTALVALTLPQGCGDDDPVDDPASNTNRSLRRNRNQNRSDMP